MFADFSEALAAEHLPVPTPLAAGQEQAAARVVARRARDKDDLVQLLDALGLPTDEDTLTGLLPTRPTSPWLRSRSAAAFVHWLQQQLLISRLLDVHEK
ncbi:hypothetical protein [Streptomyces sp. URMC 125]|uniref:hypothetical protein n=1 Tax=Streptomyces sp. URMC 125 TaxID=3423419 RepID=UPI003F1B6634